MANYEMYKGETFVLNLTVKNSDGSPKNLTGALIYFTMKWSIVDGDNAAISQLSTGSLGGVTITNALAGLATVKMPPFATSVLTGDGDIVAVFDTKVIDSAGIDSIPEAGTITIHPAVTRAIV